MATDTFHGFLKLPNELRIMIWKIAWQQEAPRVVELVACSIDHDPERCYTSDCHAFGGKCCFHRKSPYQLENKHECMDVDTSQDTPAISCRCKTPTLLKFMDPRSPPVEVPNEGHVSRSHNSFLHFHRRHQPLSSLPLVCPESRNEINKYGLLKHYVLSLTTTRWPGDETQGRGDTYVPIYFNFGVDTLAFNESEQYHFWERDSHRQKTRIRLEGIGKVTKMLVKNDNYGIALDSHEIAEFCEQFPALVELYYQQGVLFRGPCQGELRMEPFSSSNIRLRHIWRQKLQNIVNEFRVVRASVQWLQQRCLGKSLPVIELVWTLRKFELDRFWGLDPEEDEDYEDTDDYHKSDEYYCWYLSGRKDIKRFLKRHKVTIDSKELEDLRDTWEKQWWHVGTGSEEI